MDVKGLIFGLAVGGAAGFACGFLVAKSKIRKEADQEIEELRSYYRKKREEILDICKPIKDNVEEGQKRYEELTNIAEEGQKNYKELANTIVANGYSSEPVKEEPKVKDPINELKEASQKVEEAKPKEIKRKDIGVQTEIISQEDYDDNTYGYDKDVIIYYIYNEVCTDSTGDVLVNPQQYIGNL